MQRVHTVGTFVVGFALTCSAASGCGDEFQPSDEPNDGGNIASGAGASSSNGSGGTGGGLPCASGETAACYDGPQGTNGIGNCAPGVHTCNPDGVSFGACVGAVLPTVEDCGTPQDEDCTGAVNDGCACRAGTVEDCYSGPARTSGVGICAAGSHTCQPDGTWGPCSGETLPGGEDCSNGLDDDCNGSACSQAAWSKIVGDASSQFVTGTAVDASGHVYMVGYFSGSIDLGGGPVISAGSDDAYVTKFDTSGTHIWTKTFGAASTQLASDVALHPNGGVVVTGHFSGAVDFGPSSHTSTPGFVDMFTLKLDDAGVVEWVATAPDSRGFHHPSVAVSAQGDVAVADTSDLGADPDVRLRKLTASGTDVWETLLVGATGQRNARDVAIDASGNIVVSGYFTGSVGALNSAGLTDAFVAKFDPSGALGQVVRLGGPGNDTAWSVAVNAAGGMAILGAFEGEASFAGQTATSAGDEDIYLLRMSAGGVVEWLKTFGDSAYQVGVAVTFDPQGGVAIAGTADGAIDFGGGALLDPGGGNAFVATFESDGTYAGPDRLETLQIKAEQSSPWIRRAS
jgi:hypothetical protein